MTDQRRAELERRIAETDGDIRQMFARKEHLQSELAGLTKEPQWVEISGNCMARRNNRVDGELYEIEQAGGDYISLTKLSIAALAKLAGLHILPSEMGQRILYALGCAERTKETLNREELFVTDINCVIKALSEVLASMEQKK